MLDFASSLYLGLRHPSSSLGPWDQLTTGRPAALQETPGTPRLARSLASLVGAESACLSASTLHLFWDLFEVLAMEPIAILVDQGAYPIARWGVERMAARGVPVATFPQHDPVALQRLLEGNAASGRRPVVLTDGVCPASGRMAPLARYQRLLRSANGWLVVDDTQALGVLGRGGSASCPYGWGGGGTIARQEVGGTDWIVGSSLAKGLGVPLAMLAGSHALVRRFQAHASTRVHCSPPSAAQVRAAERALALHRTQGEARRGRLARAVTGFRRCLAVAGLSASGGLFPMQTLRLGARATACHALLARRGIQTVLHRPRPHRPTQLSFLINATHTRAEVQFAVQALVHILRGMGAPVNPSGFNHE